MAEFRIAGRKFGRRALLFPIALLTGALALAVRLRGLGRESLWLDEGFSWSRARMPLSELIADAIASHHNPSYFVFLHYWRALGDDEFMLRLPSALTGSLAALACAALGWIVAGPVAALVAGLLFALAPVQLRFAQEARMYAPLCLCATLAVAGLAWLGAHPLAAARPLPGTSRLRRGRLARLEADSAEAGLVTGSGAARLEAHGGGAGLVTGSGAARLEAHGGGAGPAQLAWAAYVCGLLASLYLHNTAALIGLATGVAALLAAARAPALRGGFLLNFLLANLLVLLGWTPYLSTELQQAERFSESWFWARFPTGQDLLGSARELYLLGADLDSFLALLLLLMAAVGVWSLRARPTLAPTMLWFTIAGPLLVWLVSFYKPIYGTRFLLWAAPPFFALVGAGVGAVPAALVGRAGSRLHARLGPRGAGLLQPLATIGFCAVVGWHMQARLELDYILRTNEPWREVVWKLRERALPGARILTATREERMMLEYYMQRRSHPLLELPVALAERRRVLKQAGSAPRLWLVDRKQGRRFTRAEAELRKRGHVAWDKSWNETLRVIEFDFTQRP